MAALLETIHAPSDLNRANRAPMAELAVVIRASLSPILPYTTLFRSPVAGCCQRFTRHFAAGERVCMGALLETIHSPTDLKRVNPAQMAELAEHSGAFLHQTLANTTDHPGPYLGADEVYSTLPCQFTQ